MPTSVMKKKFMKKLNKSTNVIVVTVISQILTLSTITKLINMDLVESLLVNSAIKNFCYNIICKNISRLFMRKFPFLSVKIVVNNLL